MKGVSYQSVSPKLFPTYQKVGATVAAVASVILVSLASLHLVAPLYGVAAGGLAGADLLFLAVRYCSKKEELKPLDFSAPVMIPANPHGSAEEWEALLGRLAPARAHLIDGTDKVGENTEAGFHRVPYIGNYDTAYSGLCAPFIQWRLPASQLAAFPQEMQPFFSHYAQQGLLDVYFIAAQDPGGDYSARNLIMHQLAMPEYGQNGQQPPSGVGLHDGQWFTPVEMRIFQPQGIEPYLPLQRDAIPFEGNMDSQVAIYHSDPEEGGVAISPNNARFEFKPGAANHASFYVGSRFRERAAVFYVIMTRGEQHPLHQVEDSGSISTFLESQSSQPYYNNLNSLLNFN